MNAVRGGLASVWIILATLIGCAPLYVIGMVRLVTPGPMRPALTRALHGIVQGWVASNALTFRVLGITRLDVQLPTDELSVERWYLVMCNHQSWADILVLQIALRGHVPILKFFTKRQLIWVPLIGLVMWFLGFPYVRRLARQRIEAQPNLISLDRQATLDACRGFRDHPTSVLAFLEGTRRTNAKHTAQDDARFQHLLNPKLGGVSYVVTALSDRIDKVLDVTLVYPGGVPSMWELLQGHCRRVQVLVESHALPAAARRARNPDEAREALRPWIESLWQSKDQRLVDLRALAS